MADQLYFDLNGLSKHFSDKEYNERNYGAGLTLEELTANNIVKSLSAGGYKNSHNDPSFYVSGGLGKRFPLSNNIYTDLGVMAGGVTGYENAITPAIFPYASIGLKDIAKLRLMYGANTSKNPALLMMNLGIPLR